MPSFPVAQARPGFTRAEKLSDATIHVLGLIWGLVAVSVLITLSAIWRDEPAIIAGTAIYGLCLIAMLGASAAYHLIPLEHWKDPLRRLDHSAIYIKIAGTYTPFALLAGSGATFLIGMWGAALAGTILRVLAPNRFLTLGLILYLAMGWFGIFLGGELISSLTQTGFVLMLAGGVIYTLGVVFYLWDSLPFSTTIWHAHVLIATGFFYSAVMIEIADIPLA